MGRVRHRFKGETGLDAVAVLTVAKADQVVNALLDGEAVVQEIAIPDVRRPEDCFSRVVHPRRGPSMSYWIIAPRPFHPGGAGVRNLINALDAARSPVRIHRRWNSSSPRLAP